MRALAQRGVGLTAIYVFAASLGMAACSTVTPSYTTATAPTIGDPNPNASAAGATCASGDDCRSGVCSAAVCQASSNTDGVKNSDESDIDCGGSAGPGCVNGKACATNENCTTKICAEYKCSDVASGNGNPADPNNNNANGDDGNPAPVAKFDNGIKDGTETDVDCGGPADGPRCAVGKACKAHGDCASNGCAFDGICAQRASCTQLEGGQTCGATDSVTKQNDCCESAAVVGQNTSIDKYLVTAGRMRAFLTRLDGKVRDWASKLPANQWDQSRTADLPSNMDGSPGSADNANTQLGPFFGKRSCETGYHTGHTFWTPETYGDKKDFSREVLDTKALNCVPWPLLAALCAFDGGHLITESELRAAYTNGNTTAYPWGARGTYTTTAQSPFAIQEYSYVTPNAGDARQDANGFFDIAANIAPPGRRSDGYNKTGHADLVGNLLEWVGDSESQFVWKGSFERHASEADKQTPLANDPFLTRNPKTGARWHWTEIGAQDSNPNGYYALGGRCAY